MQLSDMATRASAAFPVTIPHGRPGHQARLGCCDKEESTVGEKTLAVTHAPVDHARALLESAVRRSAAAPHKNAYDMVPTVSDRIDPLARADLGIGTVGRE